MFKLNTKLMRFIQTLLFIVIANAILQPFLPWWIIVVVAFAAGFIFKQKGFIAFAAGFVGVFLLWVGYAFYLDAGNNYILSTKIATLLAALTGDSRIGLLLLTGFVGGLVSGLSALSGSLLKSAFAK